MILHNIKKYNIVGVLTHKTKTTLLIPCADFKLWVSNQLLKAADLYLHPRVIKMFEEVKN